MGGRGASSSVEKNAFDVISDKEYDRAYGTMLEKQDYHVYNLGETTWSAKDYTNAEFLAHLENSNWHSELRQLEQANLTVKELTAIKNKTTLSQWGVGSMLDGEESVKKMIESVRKKKR